MASRITGTSLIDFWQSPFVESRVSGRMAADLATACREVLGTKAASVNLRSHPVEELLSEYAKAKVMSRPATLAAYKSRFKKAVRWYLEYLDDPENWPRDRGRSPEAGVQSFKTKLQPFVFPLREDLLLALDLPLDMSAAEAKRLATFIECLVFKR